MQHAALDNTRKTNDRRLEFLNSLHSGQLLGGCNGQRVYIHSSAPTSAPLNPSASYKPHPQPQHHNGAVAGGQPLHTSASQPQPHRTGGVPAVFPIPASAPAGSAGQQGPQRAGQHNQAQPEPSLSNEPPAGSLIARVHGQGLLGYVLFTPDSTGNRRTVIRVRLTGPTSRRELFNWKIHSYPQQITALGCSSISIGPVLHDMGQLHGQLQVDKDIVISSSTIDLFGEQQLLGRTLVLHGMDSGIFSCATIVPATKKKVYQAKFHGPISGIARLIQTATATGILTEYFMYSNGTRKSSSHKWQLVEGSANDATLDARFTNEANKCNGLRGGSFIPETVSVSSLQSNHSRTSY